MYQFEISWLRYKLLSRQLPIDILAGRRLNWDNLVKCPQTLDTCNILLTKNAIKKINWDNLVKCPQTIDTCNIDQLDAFAHQMYNWENIDHGFIGTFFISIAISIIVTKKNQDWKQKNGKQEIYNKHWKYETGKKKEKTENRKQKTKNRKQKKGKRKRKTGRENIKWEIGTESGIPTRGAQWSKLFCIVSTFLSPTFIEFEIW